MYVCMCAISFVPQRTSNPRNIGTLGSPLNGENFITLIFAKNASFTVAFLGIGRGGC